jgi:hypothetical protein
MHGLGNGGGHTFGHVEHGGRFFKKRKESEGTFKH